MCCHVFYSSALESASNGVKQQTFECRALTLAGGCSSGGETLEALFLCDLQCALKARQDRNSVHCVRCCVNRCVTVQNIAGSPNGNWKGRESGYNVKRELGRGPTKAQEMARIRQIFSYFSPVSFRGPIMHRASPRVVKVYFSSTLCFVPLLVPLSVLREGLYLFVPSLMCL